MGFKYFPRSIHTDFLFFADGDGDTATMDEGVDLSGKPWALNGVRVAFSGVCSADIYLRVYLDAVQSTHSTRYDQILYSYSLNNSQYHLWQPSEPIIMQGSDVINISCITDNIYALTVQGWTITG